MVRIKILLAASCMGLLAVFGAWHIRVSAGDFIRIFERIVVAATTGYSTVPLASAATKPPKPLSVTATATSTCAAEIRWNEPVGTPLPETFTLNRIFQTPPIVGFDKVGTSTATILSGSGIQSYIDTYYDWRAADPTLLNDPITFTPGFSMRYSVLACDANVLNCSDESARVLLNLSGVSFYSASGKDPQSVVIQGNNGTHYIEFATSSLMSPRFMTYGGIRIERTPGGVEYTQVQDAGNGRYFFQEPGVNNAVNYEYRISAYESDRYCRPELFADQASVSGAVTVVVPAAPSGASAAFSRGPDRVDLSWTYTHSVESEFVIERAIGNAAGPYTELARVPAGTTVYADTSVDTNSRKNYYYRIRACSASGGCSYYASTDAEVSPFAITNLSAAVLSASTSTDNRVADVLVQWIRHVSPSPAKPFVVTRTGGDLPAKTFPPINTLSGGQMPSILEPDLPYSSTPYKYEVAWGTDTASTTLNLDLWRVFYGRAWSLTNNSAYSSGGVGWVNFNSVDAGKEYSVQMNRMGLLSGAAWASVYQNHGYGWVSFNEGDLAECPDSAVPSAVQGLNNCSAWFDVATGEVRGWARFYATQSYEARDQARFDGWISLSAKRVDGSSRDDGGVMTPVTMRPDSSYSSFQLGFEAEKLKEHFSFRQLFSVAKLIPRALYDTAHALVSPVDYGVRFDRSTRRFYGEAWGGKVAGWIAFTDHVNPAAAGTRYPVAAYIINRPPSVTNVKIEEPTAQQIEPFSNRTGRGWCAEEPRYRVRFDYTDLDGVNPSDPNSDRLQNVEISLVKPDGSGGLTVQPYLAGEVQRVGSPKGIASSTQEYVGWFKDPLTNGAAKSALYQAAVRARDSEDAWSTTTIDIARWALSEATTTPAYYYPLISFSWSPAPAPIGRITDFSATSSIDRSGGAAPVSSWKYEWTFPHATPGSASTPEVKVVYSRAASTTDATSITITDKNTNVCSAFDYPVENATSTTQLKRKIREQ